MKIVVLTKKKLNNVDCVFLLQMFPLFHSVNLYCIRFEIEVNTRERSAYDAPNRQHTNFYIMRIYGFYSSLRNKNICLHIIATSIHLFTTGIVLQLVHRLYSLYQKIWQGN